MQIVFLLKNSNWILFLFIFLSHTMVAQGTLTKPSIFDLLGGKGLRETTLKLNMQEMESKRKSVANFPGVLSFTDSLGQSSTWKVDLVVRGKFRRMTCGFPPLEIQFPKIQLTEAGLAKHRDYKLVTHCLLDEAQSDQIILREHLVYKMYNLITSNSLRTQLLRISYVDVNDKHANKLTRYAILIEDEDELGDRLKAVDCGDCRVIGSAEMPVDQENLMAVFQYFIGNTDWSVTGRRNVKVYKPKEGGLMIPVPYDFDWSGFVDAPYAVPTAALKKTDVRQRVFQGFPATKETIDKTIALLEQKQNMLFQLIDDDAFLEKQVKNNLKKYLQSFYNRDAAKIPHSSK